MGKRFSVNGWPAEAQFNLDRETIRGVLFNTDGREVADFVASCWEAAHKEAMTSLDEYLKVCIECDIYPFADPQPNAAQVDHWRVLMKDSRTQVDSLPEPPQ